MTTINIFINCEPDDKISVKRVAAKRPAPVQEARRFSETEKHILEIVAGMPDTAAIQREALVAKCAETVPAPLTDDRDSRLVRVSAAIADLCKGKDAPFREINGAIHFLVG